MDLWSQLIKPMLAYPSKAFSSKEWIYEIKFDGTRGIAYIDKTNKNVRLLNRRLIWFEYRYPEFKNLWKNIKADRIILDGEAVVFEKGKPNFYKLAEREHVDDKLRIELLSKQLPATYVVFDILYLDGKDLTDLPLMKRKTILQQTVQEGDSLLISEWIDTEGEKFFQAVKTKGLEGVMAKRKDSVYELGKRSKSWLKIKSVKTQDAVIIGYTTGTGKREDFGSLIVAAYYQGKLKYIGKVGTGFNEEQINQLKQKLEKIKAGECMLEEEPQLDLPEGRKPVWVKPKLVCEVKFMSWTEDMQMRAPVFLRLREDKPVEDCIII